MAHPMEATVREAYAAFGRGDLDGYLRSCTEEFAFNVPGDGGIAGTYVGKGGMYDLAGKAMSITGGTFHEEVEECWRTIGMRSSWRGIASQGMAAKRITGRRTSTTSVTVNSSAASSSHALRLPS